MGSHPLALNVLGMPGETDNLSVFQTPFNRVGDNRSWIRQKGMLLLFDRALELFTNLMDRQWQWAISVHISLIACTYSKIPSYNLPGKLSPLRTKLCLIDRYSFRPVPGT